ncbi:MAG TPA: gluconokinase, partial [Hanamia sp.]|nr:gluconokinase [Hanamia sp.]
EILLNAFKDVIKKIIEEVKFAPVSISFSSAMHGVIVIDKENKTLTPLITWSDTRSDGIAEKIKNLPEAESIYKASGTPIHSMSPLCKIVWLRENDPPVFKAAFKFISIKEYIWFKLFGVYEIDFSLASATGLFNIQTLKWNDPSLKLCGITEDQLSKPVPTTSIRKGANPLLSESIGVSPETSFCIGGSDGCMANLGSYALGKGTAALTIGTSGAVRVASPKPVYNFKEMIFNYVMDENTFICGGPVNNGGNVVQWLFKSFFDISKVSEKDYQDLFDKIDTIPSGSEGLIFLPYLYGERAPVWDGRASGVYFGVKPIHTQKYFLRAAVEGVCYSLYQVLQIVESSTNKIEKLIVGGGFINTRSWIELLADITGKKIFVIETEDSSAVGAALLNMKAMNVIDDFEKFKPEGGEIIEPGLSNHQKHEANFSVFKELYPALKSSMHQIHQNKN